jgi:hypothetical protein
LYILIFKFFDSNREDGRFWTECNVITFPYICPPPPRYYMLFCTSSSCLVFLLNNVRVGASGRTLIGILAPPEQ